VEEGEAVGVQERDWKDVDVFASISSIHLFVCWLSKSGGCRRSG
jgi:hypothetical protein